MLKRIVAGLAFSMMLVSSCSSSESDNSKSFCDTAKSKCPNDPPVDPALCKAIIGDAMCGGVFMTFLICGAANQTCRPDGTTDEEAVTRQCAKERAAAEQCSPLDGGPEAGTSWARAGVR